MQFTEGHIDGVICKSLQKNQDDRGWLTEVFREDTLGLFEPAMCYVSLTHPGVTRGPHEHRDQTDYFVFTGPGTFEVHLWDNRENSATYGKKETLCCGDEFSSIVIVPPGVVHGYKNVSDQDGLVVNCPNRLFAGWDRCDPVDEIRHEEDGNSLFVIP